MIRSRQSRVEWSGKSTCFVGGVSKAHDTAELRQGMNVIRMNDAASQLIRALGGSVRSDVTTLVDNSYDSPGRMASRP